MGEKVPSPETPEDQKTPETEPATQAQTLAMADVCAQTLVETPGLAPLGPLPSFPPALPVPEADQPLYDFPEWQKAKRKPAYYPIITLPFVGKIRISAGSEEEKGHGLKEFKTNYVRPDGTETVLTAPHRNEGIDYVSYDWHVRTWYGGEIVHIGENDGGYGKRVIVKTDATFRGHPVYQAYSHLALFHNIKVGDKVEQGHSIATMGHSGGHYSEHVDLRTFIITDPNTTLEATLKKTPEKDSIHPWTEISINALENSLHPEQPKKPEVFASLEKQ